MTFLFWIELLLWYWGVPIILWFETCLCIYLITLLIAKDGYYYHCWLDYDTGLMWAQIVPMFVLVFLVIIAIFIIIITSNHHKMPHSKPGSSPLPIFVILMQALQVIIMVEAAGAASSTLQYPTLEATNRDQLVSAKFSQRTLLAVAPLTLVNLGTRIIPFTPENINWDQLVSEYVAVASLTLVRSSLSISSLSSFSHHDHDHQVSLPWEYGRTPAQHHHNHH